MKLPAVSPEVFIFMFSSTYRKHYKETALLAYPVCISQLGHILVGAVDTAMVGMIGTNEQAAVSLATGLYTLVLVFGIGVSYGLTPLVAEADSKKDHEKIGQLLRQGLLINLLTGVLLFTLLYSTSHVLNFFDQPKNVVKIAIPFFNVMIFSMVPLSVFISLKQFTEGLSFTKAAMVISLLANFLNVILNYIFIFGKLGMEPMGVMGACWATFISRVVMAVAMLLYVMYDKDFGKYSLKGMFKTYSHELTKKILNLGIPSGLQFTFEVGAFAFAAVMIGWIGARELAAHQIALSLAAITYMIASGIGAAATVRVGNQFGLKDYTQIRMAGYSAILIAIVFMIGAALFFIIFNDSLPFLFNKEIEVTAIASSLLVIAAFFQLSDGIQVVALGALRGVKDVRVPTMVALLAYWIIGLPCSYYLAFRFNLGVQGIWYGLLIGLSISALLLYLRFNWIIKRQMVLV